MDLSGQSSEIEERRKRHDDYSQWINWNEDFPDRPKPELPEWHPLPVEPAGIQNVVTMRQARHALLNAGLLDAVDTAIAAIPDETERRQAQIDWEYATEVRKDWPWVQTLSTALGLSEEQLDQLFIEASGL